MTTEACTTEDKPKDAEPLPTPLFYLNPQSVSTDQKLRWLYEVADKIIDYDHFNMRNWFLHRGLTIDEEHENPDPHNCGTTACLLGWAPSHHAFRAMGLVYTKGGMYHIPQRVPGGEHMSTYDMRGDHDIARFFGISPYNARLLFFTGIEPRKVKKDVVKRRIQFVIENPKFQSMPLHEMGVSSLEHVGRITLHPDG